MFDFVLTAESIFKEDYYLCRELELWSLWAVSHLEKH